MPPLKSSKILKNLLKIAGNFFKSFNYFEIGFKLVKKFSVNEKSRKPRTFFFNFLTKGCGNSKLSSKDLKRSDQKTSVDRLLFLKPKNRHLKRITKSTTNVVLAWKFL